MNLTIPIFLLHGLGSNPWTLYPLQKYLEWNGFTNVYNLQYPVDELEFEEILDYVDKLMSEKCDKLNTHVVLIGQSMGGFVANQMHTRGWNIYKAIYIGSPLHGANLLNQLESILPTFIVKLLNKKPYDFLKNSTALQPYKMEPPHPYNTISMGWACSDFDGCVYKQETMFNEENHTHLSWADHRTIFANPRLWSLIYRTIKN